MATDESYCHLLLPDGEKTVCGKPENCEEQDVHRPWDRQPGCPDCGRPICPECNAGARAFGVPWSKISDEDKAEMKAKSKTKVEVES